MLTDKIILALTLLLAAVYFYATAQIPSLEIGDPLGPKAFPILLGVILVLACVLLAVEIIRAKPQPAVEKDAASADSAENAKHLWQIGGVVVWTAFYFWMFDRAGYIATTTVYLLALTIVFNRGKWLANILTSVFFTIGSYVLFAKILGVVLPTGLVSF